MDDSAANLAANLRRLREARALSQQQMARLAGIPRPTWASLEAGGSNPTLGVLTRVAAALQVSIEELIGRQPARAAAKRGPTPMLQQQMERIQRLPKAQQRFVMQTLETLLKGTSATG